MTFNPGYPSASQSPGLFPAQGNTNFARIKANFDTEHVFNDSAQVTDGVHRQMTMIARADPVALPAGTNGMIYNKTTGSTALPYYYDGASIYATPVCRAYVTWDNAGTIQGNSFNASVAFVSLGTYDITFTVALPSINPQICLSAYYSSFDFPIVCNIQTFNTSVMRVRFMRSSTEALTAITLGNLTIFGG